VHGIEVDDGRAHETKRCKRCWCGGTERQSRRSFVQTMSRRVNVETRVRGGVGAERGREVEHCDGKDAGFKRGLMCKFDIESPQKRLGSLQTTLNPTFYSNQNRRSTYKMTKVSTPGSLRAPCCTIAPGEMSCFRL
jgi:hypothetical protein